MSWGPASITSTRRTELKGFAMPKEIYEVLTDSFDVTVIPLLYSSVIQMLQHGPLLHFIIF